MLVVEFLLVVLTVLISNFRKAVVGITSYMSIETIVVFKIKILDNIKSLQILHKFIIQEFLTFSLGFVNVIIHEKDSYA